MKIILQSKCDKMLNVCSLWNRRLLKEFIAHETAIKVSNGFLFNGQTMAHEIINMHIFESHLNFTRENWSDYISTLFCFIILLFIYLILGTKCLRHFSFFIFSTILFSDIYLLFFFSNKTEIFYYLLFILYCKNYEKL